MPPSRKTAYDARQLIRLVVDNGEFFEMRRYYGGAVITGFARLDGYSVGVIGSDPADRRRHGRGCRRQDRPLSRSL